MARAKKLPSGNWRVRICLGKDEYGKYRYKSFTDTDRKRCERKAAEYCDEHRTYEKSDVFENAMENYITTRQPLLSPATIRGYRNIQRQMLENYSAFCKTDLHEISKETYQGLVNEWSYFLSAKTIRNRTGLISAVLLSNDVTPPKVTLPAKQRPDLKIPDYDDVRALLKIAEGTEMEVPIMLGAFVPMRRSEIVGLTMDDIEGNTIHIHQAIVRGTGSQYYRKGTKTYKSDRRIEIFPEIIRKIHDKGHIFDSENPDRISERFYHIAKRAGCEGVRFHDLRHFSASWYHAQGIPEKEILTRGGWTESGTMERVYTHELESERRAATIKINNLIRNTFFT